MLGSGSLDVARIKIVRIIINAYLKMGIISLINFTVVGKIKCINAYKLLRTVSRIQETLSVSTLVLMIYAGSRILFFKVIFLSESVDRADCHDRKESFLLAQWNGLT